MKFKMLTVALLASAVSLPAFAQDANSGSNAGAVSGSQSASDASNHNTNGQQQTANNAGIGNSRSDSASTANANTASFAGSASTGNSSTQGQGQTQNQGQTATNSQGVALSQTWNTQTRRVERVYTNNAVPLAASSSFSSDYCGGTASGGASAAPIGISIGGSGPVFDNSCRYARLAEKAGMLAANAYNMGFKDLNSRAIALEVWATCNMGPRNDKHRDDGSNYTMEACRTLGLLGSSDEASSPPVADVTPPQSPEVTPLEAAKPNTTSDEQVSGKAPRN